MTTSVEKVCDPDSYQLDEAIQLARSGAEVTPGFEVKIVRYLRAYLSTGAKLATLFRGLEVLGGMLGQNEAEDKRLLALMRPFLKSRNPQIASKSVLVLGCHSAGNAWVRNVLSEPDDRIRANLIEALWNRNEPGVEQVLKSALKDPHRRVVANAAYALYRIGVDEWHAGLDRLLRSDNPGFRISGIWVLKKTCARESAERLRPMISDPHPGVRRAAFDALIALRQPAAPPT